MESESGSEFDSDSDTYEGPDAIVDANLDYVPHDYKFALNAWNDQQKFLEYLDPQSGRLTSRVWSADWAAADVRVPFFFGRGGRLVHVHGQQGRTLSPSEYADVAAELQPEVNDIAHSFVSPWLGYIHVGVVVTHNITPDHPYIWVYFVPTGIEYPFGAHSVVTPGQDTPRSGASLDLPLGVNEANVRACLARAAGRELRRRFALVTGLQVGIPVSADPKVHHPFNGVDMDDSDEILLPNILEGDDRFFVDHPAVEMDGPEEVADMCVSESEDGEDESEEVGNESEVDDGEDDDGEGKEEKGGDGEGGDEVEGAGEVVEGGKKPPTPSALCDACRGDQSQKEEVEDASEDAHGVRGGLEVRKLLDVGVLPTRSTYRSFLCGGNNHVEQPIPSRLPTQKFYEAKSEDLVAEMPIHVNVVERRKGDCPSATQMADAFDNLDPMDWRASCSQQL